MSEQVSKPGPEAATAAAPEDAGGKPCPCRPCKVRPQTVALLAVAVVFGLLLWAKLLLVTGHPRTAIADPDEAAPAASQATAAADGGSGGSR